MDHNSLTQIEGWTTMNRRRNTHSIEDLAKSLGGTDTSVDEINRPSRRGDGLGGEGP